MKSLVSMLVLALAAGAALFWLPTGRLLLAAARRFGGSMIPVVQIGAIEGSLRQGYEISDVAIVSGDETLLTLARAAVSPDWGLISSGTPWISLVDVQGLSSDVVSLRALGNRFGGGEREPSGASEPFVLHPLRASVRDVRIGLDGAQGGPRDARLDALTLDEDGALSMRAHVGDLPLEADARLIWDPLQIVSSDLRLGQGRGSFKGLLTPPFDLRGDLSALPIETILSFVPDAPLRADGRLDGRFHLTGDDPMIASGVISVPRGQVMDVPLSFRAPWRWDGRSFVLDGSELRTSAADVRLTASADLGDATGLRVVARGDARGISLREIGKIVAPSAGLAGEGGRVSFDLSAVMGDGLPVVTGALTARLPEVSVAGKRIVKGLAADARLAHGEAPRLSCTGEVFGGKLFGRAEVADASSGALRPRAIISLVNVDLATIAGAFPAAAGAAPSGRATLRLQIEEDLSVRGDLTSDGISASGVTLQTLAARLRYDQRTARAVLEGLTGRLPQGRGRAAELGATGSVDLRSQTLALKANVKGLDPSAIPQLKGAQFKGLCDIDATVGGTLSSPTASVHLKGKRNSVADVPLGDLSLSVSYASDRLSIPQTRISLPGGAVSLRGDVGLGGAEPRLDMAVSTEGLDLAQTSRVLKLKEPVRGTVRGRASVRGPLSTATVAASLRADDVRTGEITIPYAIVEARGDMRRIDAEKVEVKVGDALIKGKGKLTMGKRSLMDSALDVALSVRGLEIKPLLRRFMDRPPVGGILNGSLGFKGTLADPRLALRLTSPLLVGQILVDEVALSARAPSRGRYALDATGKVGDFRLDIAGDVQQGKKGWAWSVETAPIDVARLIAVASPGLKGMVAGAATVSAKGSLPGDGPIHVHVSVPKLTAIDKVAVEDVSLPLSVMLSSNRIEMKDGRATLSDGQIRSTMDVDLAKSGWKGDLHVRGLDMGKLAAPFMPEGALVGSTDVDVEMKGSFGGAFSMAVAKGAFTTSSGYLHEMAMIDKISPTKRITFQNIRGTFFWNGADLFLAPGTQATAGPEEPLYRYFAINGSMGIPGKGLKLMCRGRFDLKLLDQFLGALKGLFQFAVSGALGGGNFLRDSMGRALGVKRRDFQDVSFTLANSWQELRLLDLKIDKPIQDFLPIDRLNDEEQRRDDKQFRLDLKFPTGPGDESVEDGSPEDQLKQQLIDNLFNIGG